MNTSHRNVPSLVPLYGRPLLKQEDWRSGIAARIKTATEAFALWRRRLRERDELSQLSAIERQDLSLSPCDVARETGKWFWQA